MTTWSFVLPAGHQQIACARGCLDYCPLELAKSSILAPLKNYETILQNITIAVSYVIAAEIISMFCIIFFRCSVIIPLITLKPIQGFDLNFESMCLWAPSNPLN
jgi:hypothetical protein